MMSLYLWIGDGILLGHLSLMLIKVDFCLKSAMWVVYIGILYLQIISYTSNVIWWGFLVAYIYIWWF